MGEKASLNLGKRYWKIVLNGKSCACTSTKSIFRHALVIWSKILNSSFLLLYFFNLLLSLSLFLFFRLFSLSPFFWSLFMLYTMIFPQTSPPTCESGVQSFFVPFCLSLNLLLLTVRLLVHCAGITSTLMRLES